LLKPFDTVPHRRLLYKLHWYGIRGKAHSWIKSFLTDRHHKVLVENTCSSQVCAVSGVLQGTVLGPILFLIFINDLPDDIKNSTLRLFAGDCILYKPIQISNDYRSLQEDLLSLEQWEAIWLKKFNPSQCFLMNISLATKHKILYNYTLHGCFLSKVDQLKYLGITIQNNLKWASHISEITSKVNRTLVLLRRNLCMAPKIIKEQAYFTLVRPQIEYAVSAWAP